MESCRIHLSQKNFVVGEWRNPIGIIFCGGCQTSPGLMKKTGTCNEWLLHPMHTPDGYTPASIWL